MRVNRTKFLTKELKIYYPEKIVALAIEKNPAYVGIDRRRINKIAKQVIDFETNKVATISFAAGIPGGFAMIGTVPADLTQYFAFMIRVMQKLAYLYGFEDFNLNEDEISDDTLNQILIFLGVMFGVQGANTGVKKLAELAAKKISKSLARKSLTKGAIYPIIKKIATKVGIQMTKQIFADGVSKVVPIVGGVVSGGLSYISFKSCAIKLKKSFSVLPLSDPDFYDETRKEDGVERFVQYKTKKNCNREDTRKYISLILRHKPEVIGITLDEHGWANVDELIAGVSKTHEINMDILEEIVSKDEKQRYSFNDDKTKIRANQGHSVNVNVDLTEFDPPEYLWHGTAEKYVSSIDDIGLIPKSRLYVHLSQDKETA